MFDNMVLCQSPACYKDLQLGEGAKKANSQANTKRNEHSWKLI